MFKNITGCVVNILADHYNAKVKLRGIAKKAKDFVNSPTFFDLKTLLDQIIKEEDEMIEKEFLELGIEIVDIHRR